MMENVVYFNYGFMLGFIFSLSVVYCLIVHLIQNPEKTITIYTTLLKTLYKEQKLNDKTKKQPKKDK